MRLRESALEDWEKNPLPHLGLELASVLRLAFSRTLYPLSYRRPLVFRQERRENCFLQGQLFVLGFIWSFGSIPVLTQGSRKDPYDSAKSADGRLQLTL